jgi:hypothetical protein
MDQLKRLQTLIGITDAVLEQQEQGGKNVDAAALVVAMLIDREIRSVEAGMVQPPPREGIKDLGK